MLRSRLNSALSNMAKSLSPNTKEKDWIHRVYSAIDETLAGYDCMQIGSYPRYTSISPIHDLDILCSIENWSGPRNPKKELTALRLVLNSNKNLFKKLPEISSIQLQKHSVCIEFKNSEYPSIDLIPCFSSEIFNEFGNHLYYVPETSRMQKCDRSKYTGNLKEKSSWILSDPKGYINLAKQANGNNECFRKTTKLLKYWKKSLYENSNIKLKSFHLEQLALEVANNSTDMIETTIESFRRVSTSIKNPNQIPDRAQQDRFIDDYVAELRAIEIERIDVSIKNCLAALEKMHGGGTIKEVFSDNNKEISKEEQFITYDYGFIPCIDEKDNAAEILCNHYENRTMRSKVDDEKLYFKLENSQRKGLEYYWKVSNSHNLSKDKWRGEITKGRTYNYPETKAYSGVHQVECYAINNNGECISYCKYPVELA